MLEQEKKGEVKEREESKEEIKEIKEAEKEKWEKKEEGKEIKEEPITEEAKEEKLLEKIEAILFIAGRFLSIEELVMYTNINPLTLKELIEKLKERYMKGVVITEKNGKYKMDVKKQHAYLTHKLAGGSAEFTKAEQETLAIIAYKQPITQALVVKIRGNKAYEHVKHFLQTGLIKAKKQGHTLLLQLSEQFYDYFGLKQEKK